MSFTVADIKAFSLKSPSFRTPNDVHLEDGRFSFSRPSFNTANDMHLQSKEPCSGRQSYNPQIPGNSLDSNRIFLLWQSHRLTTLIRVDPLSLQSNPQLSGQARLPQKSHKSFSYILALLTLGFKDRNNQIFDTGLVY